MAYNDADQGDQYLDIVKSHVARLAEHFESVQIMGTKVLDGDDGTLNIQYGSGNFYTRYGQLRSWIVGEESRIAANALPDSYGSPSEDDDDDDDDDREPDTELVNQHIAQLSEHLDAIQIFVTNPMDGGGHCCYCNGSGNWWSRYGHVRSWLVTEEHRMGAKTLEES